MKAGGEHGVGSWGDVGGAGRGAVLSKSGGSGDKARAVSVRGGWYAPDAAWKLGWVQ